MYISSIRDQPTTEGLNAELSLLFSKGNGKEAEDILVRTVMGMMTRSCLLVWFIVQSG